MPGQVTVFLKSDWRFTFKRSQQDYFNQLRRRTFFVILNQDLVSTIFVVFEDLLVDLVLGGVGAQQRWLVCST